MAQIKSFVFSPFYENTYVIYDDTKECIILDPGCYTEKERQSLKAFIEKQKLTPTYLVNTHCHIDHVFGNRFVAETWGVELAIPDGEQAVLAAVPQVAQAYAIPNVQQSPDPVRLLKHGETFSFGNTTFKLLSAPGHSPASICFYCEAEQFIMGGDVLFEGSIGRTDLPGGDHATLLNSIKTQLFPLPDEVVVYSGHGNSTTIGRERQHNPFLTNL